MSSKTLISSGETGGRFEVLSELCLLILVLPFIYPILSCKQLKQDKDDYHDCTRGYRYLQDDIHSITSHCGQNTRQYRPPKSIISPLSMVIDEQSHCKSITLTKTHLCGVIFNQGKIRDICLASSVPFCPSASVLSGGLSR